MKLWSHWYAELPGEVEGWRGQGVEGHRVTGSRAGAINGNTNHARIAAGADT